MRIFASTATCIIPLGLLTAFSACSDGASFSDSSGSTAGATSGGAAGVPAVSAGNGGSPTTSAGAASGGSAQSGGTSSAGNSGSAGSVSNGGTGGSAGSSGSAGASTSGPPCDKSMATWSDDADKWAMHDYGTGFLRKNFWNASAAGAGTLSLWAASSRCWGAEATSDDSVKSGTVKSYPDLARGWVIGTAGVHGTNSGLPILVSELRKAKIHWSMKVSGSPLRHYALWDIYFHETNMPGKGTAPVNLMIKQRVVDPSKYEQDKESGGAMAKTNVFSGITFRENKNSGLTSGSRAVIQLFPLPVEGNDMGLDDMTLDLKEVIDHYVADGTIKNTDYLTSIQAGWEILAGGSFVTNDFWTVLQDEVEPSK